MVDVCLDFDFGEAWERFGKGCLGARVGGRDEADGRDEGGPKAGQKEASTEPPRARLCDRGRSRHFQRRRPPPPLLLNFGNSLSSGSN